MSVESSDFFLAGFDENLSDNPCNMSLDAKDSSWTLAQKHLSETFWGII